MIQQFVQEKDLIACFANTMNLVSPEVQNHHQKVAYIAYRLAECMGMDEKERRLAFFGGVLHDIGGILQQGNVSLWDIERNAREISVSGAALLRMYPATLPFADIVRESQTPWQRMKTVFEKAKVPQQLGQIVHLADVVSLQLNEKDPVLNQVGRIRECVHSIGAEEFSPSVLEAFDKLCIYESAWMDIMYRPQLFLELWPGNRWFSLDETVIATDLISKVVDFRSPFTAMHSAGVAATAVALAEQVGMSEDECKQMRIAGYLHDIGKLKIPNELLEKPGKLTDEEFNIMKEHAYYTWILLKEVKGFEQITAWAALHHEKQNGNGYPFHLSEGDLSLGSRIMTVADIFSALTEDRPYRKRMEKDKVIPILRGDAAQGLISSGIVEMLIGNYDEIDRRRDIESRAASKKYQQSLEARG